MVLRGHNIKEEEAGGVAVEDVDEVDVDEVDVEGGDDELNK